MAAAGTSADLISLNSPEIDSAWHILSVLIRQGCAAQLPELASRSGLPQNLLDLLSRIPEFPLTVTAGEFINASGAVGEEFAEFVTGIANLHVPRDVFTFLGLRRGGLNVSVTYARKRKAREQGNAAEFLTSSKRRSLLTHKRGEGESTKNKGVPNLFPSSNEISRKVTFDVTSPSDGEQHSVGTGPLDGLGQLYDFSMPLHELIYFDFGNISCMSEDARASGSYTNSLVPHSNVLDLSNDHAFIDVGLNANIVEEHAFQRQEVVEHDFRPLLDGMLNQPLPVNQILGEDCNTLSLELGFFNGIPEVQALERLTVIEKDFESSLTKRVPDDDALMDRIDHYSQNALLLACRMQPVTEAIDERKMNSKDDKLITAQLESNEMIVDSRPSYCQRKETSTFNYAFGDVANNSAAVGLAMMSDSADVSEEKQRRSSKPSTDDDISLARLQNVVGPNFASIITSFAEERVKNVENSSEQKLMPCFKSFITEEEEASGIYLGGNGTVYKAQRKEVGNNVTVKYEAEHMKAEGVPKLSPFSNEIIKKSPPKKKLMPNFEFFIKQNKKVSGKEEPVNEEGHPKLLPISNQIPRKVNFDVPSPSDNEQNSAGMDILDCSTVRLHQEYNFPAPLHDFNYFELRNVSYIKEEDTRESATYITNSVFHNEVDLSYEDLSLDVVPNANMKKKHALQRLRVVEPDFRPLLDGLMHQPSVVNLTLGEDCNAIELGFLDSISQVHAHESLSMIDKNLEESLLEQAWNETKLRHIENDAQNPSLLEYRNQLVIEAIDENKIHSMDDKLTTGQLESNENIVAFKFSQCHRKESLMSNFAFGDNAKNSAAIESASMDELAGALEEKQWTFNNPTIKDQVASVELQYQPRSNFASNSNSSTKDQDRNIETGLIHHQKVKDICKVNIPSKEKKLDFVTKPSKNFSEQKLLPNFESFIIEEEEGSGGYGTVYKAQRKEDGKIVAVKCPHANAHSHHVNNELKMLERFGGRNFVIKYEGSFKNGDSECFVLEHVEHDRPEVLKKEIGLFELQWYGFCMFKALASLHKQGVVHRDVKPGNFLFSRNVNKGYLIDFNLASDLHMKFCRSSKRKMSSGSANQNQMPESKLLSSLHSRKFIHNGFLENTKKEASNESKKVLASKSSKKKTLKDREDGFPIIDKSKPGSQTADVSGLTSTKDQTSNKSPADWLNQPIPCKGRKELIKFVHKAMHSTQILKPTSNGPSSQRKRVAAPMAPNDTGLLILTPMPLHSGGNVIAGAGLKSKAGGKVKREGPCVGTKGFRAPEVLFKSFHQGCKIDMWSAGVTILYLMIGRAPFGGDPEQNIKEIARLRGSEELWEVAKLHNCEASFPVDLLDVGSLNSMKLRDWCAKNTRRPDFFELIPESLFDLVDRCLTVNPRCRLSAEEALMHKFFTPCHDSFRKLRMLRKVVTSDPSSSNP